MASDDSAPNEEIARRRSSPASSDKLARNVAAAFAFVFLGGILAAFTMLVVWGLVALYGLLFG